MKKRSGSRVMRLGNILGVVPEFYQNLYSPKVTDTEVMPLCLEMYKAG